MFIQFSRRQDSFQWQLRASCPAAVLAWRIAGLHLRDSGNAAVGEHRRGTITLKCRGDGVLHARQQRNETCFSAGLKIFLAHRNNIVDPISKGSITRSMLLKCSFWNILIRRFHSELKMKSLDKNFPCIELLSKFCLNEI